MMKPLLALGVAAVLFSGCASVSVTGVQHRAQAVHKPAVIYVADFDTGGGQWNVTSHSRSPEQFRRETANALAEALTKDLNTYVGPAQRIGSARSAPRDGWVVTGRFIRVNEGSPAGRIIVGLGAGASKMETETLVYDAGAGRRPFLQFGTTGGSNAMPGVIFSTGPGDAVVTTVSQAMRGVRDDTHRTSKMITASISEYMAQRGWLTGSRIQVKRPGEFQLVQPAAVLPPRHRAE